MVQVNPAEVGRCFGDAYYRRLQSRCVGQARRREETEIGTSLLAAYFSASNLEATRSCEISVTLLIITGLHIPEDNSIYFFNNHGLRTTNPAHGSSSHAFALNSQNATSIHGTELALLLYPRTECTLFCGDKKVMNTEMFNYVVKILLYADDRMY
jgi:hypothetical protein